MGHLRVEADDLVLGVHEGPGHRVVVEAHPQAAALEDGGEARSARDRRLGSRRRRAQQGHGGERRAGREAPEELGRPGGLGHDAAEERPAAEDRAGHEESAHHEVAREARPVELDPAGDEAGAEDGHHQRVHGRGHGPEAAVEDAGDDEELEEVGRDPREVEQERDRGVDAPEDREEPGAREGGVARGRDVDAGVPAGEEHEADGEHLRPVGEVEGGRHEHVHELVLPLAVRPAVLRPPLGEERARALHQDGEDDEEVRRDERGDQRVLGDRDHPPVPDRRERGHEPREEPEGQQAGEDGVGEHEPLQPPELLELHGAGRVPGDREDAERGESGRAGSPRAPWPR